MDYKKIGVIVADVEEFRPLFKSAEEFSPEKYDYFERDGLKFTVNGKSVICVYSGVGKVNAAAATMHLIDKGCECVLNFGLSGGLNDSLRGQLTVPDRFIEHDFDMTVLGYLPCQKPAQDGYILESDKELKAAFKSVVNEREGGTAVSGDSFISSAEVSERLVDNFNAFSCDMETAAIAAVCDMAKIPFCALRRISDDASDGATDTYRDMNETEGSVLSDAFIKCLKKICE